MSSKRVRRAAAPRGMTLVELLVVIAIIGILTALLIPAVGVVRYRVWQTRVTVEMANIDRGFQGFEEKFGEQPPDFSDVASAGWTNSAGYRFLRSKWKLSSLELETMRQLVINGHMDNATCLWFWLAGTSESVTTPFTSTGGPLSTDPLNNAYHDFQNGRLVSRTETLDLSAAGGPSSVNVTLKQYLPIKVKAPFVYFDSRTYDFALYDQASDAFFPEQPSRTAGVNQLRPYVTFEELDGGARRYEYAKPRDWQVIAAGNDDDFAAADVVVSGVPVRPSAKDKQGYHPTNPGAVPADYFELHDDNFANFAEGVELGDLE